MVKVKKIFRNSGKALFEQPLFPFSTCLSPLPSSPPNTTRAIAKGRDSLDGAGLDSGLDGVWKNGEDDMRKGVEDEEGEYTVLFLFQNKFSFPSKKKKNQIHPSYTHPLFPPPISHHPPPFSISLQLPLKNPRLEILPLDMNPPKPMLSPPPPLFPGSGGGGGKGGLGAISSISISFSFLASSGSAPYVSMGRDVGGWRGRGGGGVGRFKSVA